MACTFSFAFLLRVRTPSSFGDVGHGFGGAGAVFWGGVLGGGGHNYSAIIYSLAISRALGRGARAAGMQPVCMLAGFNFASRTLPAGVLLR